MGIPRGLPLSTVDGTPLHWDLCIGLHSASYISITVWDIGFGTDALGCIQYIYIYQLSLMGDLMMGFMHYIAFSIIHQLLLIGVLIWDLGLLYCISVRYFIYR